MFARPLLASAAAAATIALAAPFTGAMPQEADDPARAFAAAPAGYDEYRIGAYDLLVVEIFGQDELKSTRRVTEEGTITLPLLREVRIGGLTPHAAEELLERMFREQKLLVDPEVSVFVEEYVSSRVSVQGAVEKPGLFPLLGRRTLLDIVGEAGGLDEKAGKKIFVLRPFAKEREQRIEIDSGRLVFDGDPAVNIPLRPGDIVMIPFLKTIRIYVTGAVSKPGVLEFPDDEQATILQAIATAGGVTERANETRITVIRRLDDGARQLIRVNLKRIKRGKAQDLPLQAGDTVVVKESFF
jgi:polysaccharide export outer membrane protein